MATQANLLRRSFEPLGIKKGQVNCIAGVRPPGGGKRPSHCPEGALYEGGDRTAGSRSPTTSGEEAQG